MTALDAVLILAIITVLGAIAFGGALIAVRIDRKRRVARIREMI